MKAALIPPIPHLDQFGRGPFHLLLAHLLRHTKYAKYRAHYKAIREEGAYLILDNSAHEKGSGEDAEELMYYALDMEAQEVVVPDVLDDGLATVEACIAAHETWYEGKFSGMQQLDPALMYVPQGKDMDEWWDCFRQLVSIHEFASKRYGTRRDLVLGVSKDYEVWDGGIYDLLVAYVGPMRNDLLARGIRMQVHILGWGRDLWKLEELAQDFSWLRSTDSAKPFVYAMSDVKLNPQEVPEYPRRPARYFQKKMTEEQIEIAQNNVWLFKAAALGNLEGLTISKVEK